MFHIKSLELVHWDYWQRFTLPLDAQIVTIVGPNGSGKTTLLDAMRTLFGLKCSGKREYKRYVRRSNEVFAWLRAVVDNRRIDNRRHPFFPLLDDEVTLACRIRKQGGEWQRQYLIVPGNAAIETLESSGDWLGVIEYQRRMDNAGLTKAIAEVLSLEQGDTDKLCEYSPKTLLDLVFQVFGDKEVLDAYLEAKGQQRETERELQEMSNNLEALDNKVEKMTLKVNNHIQWRNLKQEQITLQGEVLPRLQLLDLRESINGARSQIQGNRRLLREKQQALEAKNTAITGLKETLRIAQEQEGVLRLAEKSAAENFQASREAVIRIHALLEQRDNLVALSQSRHGEDLVSLAETLGRERQRLATLQNELAAARTRLDELTASAAALNSGKQVPPEYVREFRVALKQAEIPHCMLIEIVEVVDTAWQAAVEALLAPYRQLVLLENEADRAKAWQIGETVRYRHFVAAERLAASASQAGSLLEVIRFTAAAPGWLIQLLNQVQRVEDSQAGAKLPVVQNWITRAGYHRERRGGRFIGVGPADYHFGEAGRRSRLDAWAAEARTLSGQIGELTGEAAGLRQTIAQKQAQLDGLDAAQMLALRSDEFAQAEHQSVTLKQTAQQAADAVAAASSKKDEAVEARHQIELALKTAHATHDQLAQETGALAPQLQNQRADNVKRIQRLRHDRQAMPPAWYAPAALLQLRERFASAEGVKLHLLQLENRLATEDWETDENIIALRDKLRGDLEGMQADVAKRQAANERARSLTHDAREAYINRLRATIRRYGKNIRELGELAGIEVHCEPPHLENDDLILAQAGLAVNFNFDKKGLTGLNDGEASGGQQVMKSLILLIGLMMDESQPGGFVFIDEPFAHLDIFNIDRVGSFLKATRSQYLITTPITHNVNIYDPAELTLVTYKKRPEEPWAPPVAQVSRQKQKDERKERAVHA
ncbi:MAG: AAA family ATPase [Nitrosospira sp.]|nr:AAA family ATPase [Nitrosospira sp.]